MAAASEILRFLELEDMTRGWNLNFDLRCSLKDVRDLCVDLKALWVVLDQLLYTIRDGPLVDGLLSRVNGFRR